MHVILIHCLTFLFSSQYVVLAYVKTCSSFIGIQRMKQDDGSATESAKCLSMGDNLERIWLLRNDCKCTYAQSVALGVNSTKTLLLIHFCTEWLNDVTLGVNSGEILLQMHDCKMHWCIRDLVSQSHTFSSLYAIWAWMTTYPAVSHSVIEHPSLGRWSPVT